MQKNAKFLSSYFGRLESSDLIVRDCDLDEELWYWIPKRDIYIRIIRPDCKGLRRLQTVKLSTDSRLKVLESSDLIVRDCDVTIGIDGNKDFIEY